MPVYGSGLYGVGLYAGAPLLTDVSADGNLSARYLSDRRGVLLRAQFLQSILQTHTFESTTESFAAVGTGTLTRNTTSPLTGTGDLKLAWTTGTGTRGVSRTYTGGSVITGPKNIRIKFKIKTDDPLAITPTPVGQDDYWSLRVEIFTDAGKFYKQEILPRPGVNVVRTGWYADFFIPAGKKIGKFTILVDNTTTNKNLWLDDIQIIELPPDNVRFTRKTTNNRVRGGDPAKAVSGVAYAYDDELWPGKLTEWYAEPVFTNGNAGLATGTVDFTIEDRPTTQPSHMIKSVETPGLIIYTVSNQRSFGRSRSATFVNKEFDGKPAGGVNSAYSLSGDYQFITTNIEDMYGFMEILEEAVLYVQPPGRYNKPPFYATVISYKIDDFGKMSDPEKIFTITFQEVERPNTLNQPSFIPLHDYEWLSTQALTYASTVLTSQTYDQLSFSSVP